MAQYNVDNYDFKKGGNYSNERKVGYFNSLKDDGDEAIVRFAYASISEVSVETVHKVQVDGKWRSVSCIKGAYDPIENCPLCASGYDLKRRVYVKLVEYVPSEDGSIVAEAKIWDRPAEGKSDFVKLLKSYFDEYGDLRNMVFKIKRIGEKGSLQTTYSIIPANPNVYKDTVYVKDFSAFENFTPAHHSFMLKSKEDLQSFVDTGSFPVKEKTNYNNAPKTQTAPTTATPVARPVASTTVTPTEAVTTKVATETVNVAPTTATEQAPVTATRPKRVYDF